MSTRWRVRLRKPTGGKDAVLGVVTERLWFDARKEACQRYGVEPGDIEVTPLPDEPTTTKPDEPIKPTAAIKPTANGIAKKR